MPTVDVTWILTCTPPKTDMEPKNPCIQDEHVSQRWSCDMVPWESYLVGVNTLYPDWHLVILAGSRRSPGCSLWTATQWFMALLGVVTQGDVVCAATDMSCTSPAWKWLVYGTGMEDNMLWTILEWIVESCWHFLYVTYVFLVSLLFSSPHFHAVKIHFISTRSSVHRQSPQFVELCIASSLYARAH